MNRHPSGHALTPILPVALLGALVAAPAIATPAAEATAASTEARTPAFLDLPRSEDDRGFSIVLLSPSDLFLTGRQTLHIEPIIPRGDSIEEVDFFLDGRLLATDRKTPYETAAEFGGDIRRHTIEIRATTRDGRRAKVSLITRSGDISEGATARILAVPVVARRPTGEMIDDLAVSEISVSEDGEARPIAYFAPGPFPASIALVADVGGTATAGLAEPLVGFLRELPAQDSTALVEGAYASAEAASAAFSFDPVPVITRLRAEDAAAATPWAARVASAAQALEERRGLRVLVMVTGAEAAPQGRDLLEDPSAPALDAALESGATLYAVVVGAAADGTSAFEGLGEAAGRSGGSFHAVADAAGLERALQEIGAELRSRAIVGFIPAEEQRTGWRSIQVRLRGREAVVRAPRSVRLP
jgi:hypothetical protein